MKKEYYKVNKYLYKGGINLRNEYGKNPVIIIPAYRPDERLLNLIYEIRKRANFPIVIIDDGSGDEYKNIFLISEKVNNCSISHNEYNIGKGASLKRGVRYAKMKYPDNCGYITCDADGQHSVEDIISVSKELMENKNCLILGVRDFSKDNVPKKSRIGNLTSSIFFSLITGKKCDDTQTGLRGIQREHEEIFFSTPGERYEFEMNFLTTIAKNNIKLKEVKIKTIYIEENKSSHYRAFKDSIRIFSGLLKYIFSSGISFIIDISLFTILYMTIFNNYIFGAFIATVLARIFSGIVNFLLNQRWVFNGERNYNELIKYSILFILQMLFSGLLVSIFTKIIVNATIAKLIVDFSLFIISYIIQKNLIFNNRKKNIIYTK